MLRCKRVPGATGRSSLQRGTRELFKIKARAGEKSRAGNTSPGHVTLICKDFGGGGVKYECFYELNRASTQDASSQV